MSINPHGGPRCRDRRPPLVGRLPCSCLEHQPGKPATAARLASFLARDCLCLPILATADKDLQRWALQAIGILKAAFVQGMLARDEFDLRVGQALAARTCADLAALSADLAAGLAVTQPRTPPYGR